ncbi:MAG: acylphosphatase [Verrucomicrobia bacterium]|nr:acylphosphatase [Verrucomicrobiota bacterium]MCH8512445.1 acylphosphatase [Kiritimatiellia bacterium]
MKTEKAIVTVFGEVQGVGFRFTTRALSQKHAVKGWVRNQPDGSVRIEAEGGSEALDRFFLAVKTSRLGPGITRWEETRGPPTDMAEGFDVRFF